MSTKVGGIPEVLPPDLIYLAEPTVPALLISNYGLSCFLELKPKFSELEKAIDDLNNGRTICPFECNDRIRRYYNWPNITTRTEVVYNSMVKREKKSLKQQLEK